MDFASSITLKFNDLFSSGFQQAYTSVLAFKGSLDGISGSGLGTVQSELAGVGSALAGVNPAGLSGIGAAAASVTPPIREVKSELDELEEMLGGSVAHLGGVSDSLAGIGGAALPASLLPRPSGIGNVFGTLKTNTVTNMKSAMGGMNAAMEQINKNQALNQMAAGMAVMANMTNPLRQSLSNMMGEPSRLAGTFESSLRNIQSLTGDTNETIAELGKTLLEMGGKAVDGPNAVADAFYNVTSGVGDVGVRIDVMRSAIALAEAGQEDLGAATNGLISVVNAYGTSAENISSLSDVFFQTLNKGKGTLGGFVSSMSSIAGISATLGIGFDELGSSMAIISKTQTEAVAATQLKSAMMALLKPNTDMAGALKTLGIESGSALVQEYGLAASLNMVKSALGGSNDALTAALGSGEAAQAAFALTTDTYTEFAAEYSKGLSGATGKALEAQTQSYESRVARLQAASDSLKIKIGGDINRIKGFFVDMGAVFLNHVVTPIVNSPAGPVFSNIAAVTGLAAKGVLDMGSGVLNTAAQFSVLAVNIQNAKGFTNLFKSSLEFLGAPFKAVGGMVRGFITNLFGIGASSGIAAAGTGGLGVAGAGAAGGIGAAAGATGAFAASLWAAAWPILAVVGAVALLAGSTYLLIKNWDSVAGFFVGLWNKITGVFSAAGDSISAFFVNLRQKITGVFSVARTWITAFFPSLANSIGNFFSPVIGKISGVISSFANRVSGIWNTVTDTFTSAWGHVVSFFSSLWNTMVSIVINAGNWFVSVWGTITDTFAGAWGHVVSFFSSLWNTMVSIVTNAGNWFASVWGTVTNTFAGAWLWVSNLFTSIWEGMKGVVLGFVEWLSPVIDAILAPFREMGRVIGGITTTVGGWFGDAVNAGNSAVAEMKLNQDITRTATALTEAAAPSALTDTAPFLPGTVTSAVAAPFFGEPIVPPSAFSGNTVPASETLPAFAAPLRASAPELTYTASSAFSNAVSGASAMLTPALDMSALERQVDMRLPQAPAVAAPWQKTTAEQPKQAGPISISVRHLTVQAEDIKDAVDFYRILMNTVYQPEEAPV